ncbi:MULTISPECIES: winged helix DNA-binding domain-containing protein [Microbacterium]|uniref:winged helix DNA-binding domain-containing protein n=1 Tax=Microbacterium TaxID=33882 RepID=UPI00214B221D|nr:MULTISPECIES: winged helix DNA-binding domain-containing protein [unclassified Microbacterium]MCR2813685.1 winged helix DNA-binding domain-containing protein [Microbacterium sp. zg.Y1084]MDL5488100.1 winged helix DNA-binding domain-containing protein [Microbacterium sp. zg-Y1211]
MDAASLRRERLRSQRLSAPAATVAEAASHMLAVQAQEFWGGRWALAARTRGSPTLSDVDAAFDRGDLVRAWTMRGTIHIVPARDLAWVLSLTGARQRQQAAGVHRAEGIDDAESLRAERAVRAALRGGGRLTRAELFAALEAAGVSTARQRGYHLLVMLSTRLVVCQGPVVPRADGPTREQSFVLVDEWAGEQDTPADPLAAFFTRFVTGHGPAGARDFAWWSGLPLGVARAAAEAAADEVEPVGGAGGGARFVRRGPAPRRIGTAPPVLALSPFEEPYLPYADRAVMCPAPFLPEVGPSKNGMVRPILVADGEVCGVWSHSRAAGRHAVAPEARLFGAPAATPPSADVAAALARFLRFVTS